MARKSRADMATYGELHTEACPKQRRRWRRDVIPELGAWLMMHARRYETLIRTLQSDRRLSALPQTAGRIAHARTVSEAIGLLIGALWDRWDGPEWVGCITDIREAVEIIKAKQQCPPDVIAPAVPERAG